MTTKPDKNSTEGGRRIFGACSGRYAWERFVPAIPAGDGASGGDASGEHPSGEHPSGKNSLEESSFADEDHTQVAHLITESFGDAIKTLIPLACAALLLAMCVRYNPTPSVPQGLYVRIPNGAPNVGEYAFACLHGKAAQVARSRGYVPSSWYQCDSGLQALLKRVVASGGDTVVVDRAQGLVVNGSRVGPLPATHDSRGRPVYLQEGTHVLEEGEFWLGSTAYMGYDSRVFGPVPASWLRGRGIPVWTRPVPRSMVAPPGEDPPIWSSYEPSSKRQRRPGFGGGTALPPSSAPLPASQEPTDPRPFADPLLDLPPGPE